MSISIVLIQVLVPIVVAYLLGYVIFSVVSLALLSLSGMLTKCNDAVDGWRQHITSFIGRNGKDLTTTGFLASAALTTFSALLLIADFALVKLTWEVIFQSTANAIPGTAIDLADATAAAMVLSTFVAGFCVGEGFGFTEVIRIDRLLPWQRRLIGLICLACFVVLLTIQIALAETRAEQVLERIGLEGGDFVRWAFVGLTGVVTVLGAIAALFMNLVLRGALVAIAACLLYVPLVALHFALAATSTIASVAVEIIRVTIRGVGAPARVLADFARPELDRTLEKQWVSAERHVYRFTGTTQRSD